MAKLATATVTRPEEIDADEWAILKESAAAEVAKRRAAAQAEADRLAAIEQERLARVQAAERFAVLNQPARIDADIRRLLDVYVGVFTDTSHADATNISAQAIGDLIRVKRALLGSLQANFPGKVPALELV